MPKRLLFLLALLPCFISVHGKDGYVLQPDSSNFVIASLVTATPSDAIYSSLGHCALRMECPTAGLDYCFSLEMAAEAKHYAQFFAGDLKVAVVAVPTAEFMKVYSSEGRGMTQYELNLTHHEKQNLWRLLDEELMKPPHLTFNFLNTNCVMMAITMIENCLIGERLDFGQLPAALQLDNGDLIRYHSQATPWAQFLYITLSGSACDGHYATEYRLSPKMIVEVLEQSVIRGDSTAARPALTGTRTQLLPVVTPLTPSRTTPTILFGSLLALVILITAAEWLFHARRTAKVLDIILLTLQTIAGIILFYTSAVACLFGTHWNWYLIIANPIPILCWLLFRRKPWYPKLYLLYTIVLVGFILATPLSSQLDLPHQLITASFAVRTLSHYMRWKRQTN